MCEALGKRDVKNIKQFVTFFYFLFGHAYVLDRVFLFELR